MAEIYIPRMTDAINAFEAGRQGALERQKQQAARMIGGAMSRGDYKAAAEAAFGAGDYGTGLKIEEVAKDRQTTERRARYGELYAGGKGKDAVAEAYRYGDFEIGGELQKVLDQADKASKQAIKDRAGAIADIVAPLGEIPETNMAERKAYIMRMAPQLLAAGYTQEQLDTFEPTDANLAPIFSQAMGIKDYLSDRRAAEKATADEQYRASQLAISRGQLGVAQGNLAQRQAEHSARVAGKGGYAAPGAGSYDDVPAGARVVR